MSTALAQPTGAEILATIPTPSGAVAVMGTMNAQTIDDLISANPLTNPVTRAFVAIKEVVADWQALSDERYPFAYRALIAACLYELEAIDMAGRAPIPSADGGGLEIHAYTSKMNYFASQVEWELGKLGISQSDYHFNESATATRIGGVIEIGYGTNC